MFLSEAADYVNFKFYGLMWETVYQEPTCINDLRGWYISHLARRNWPKERVCCRIGYLALNAQSSDTKGVFSPRGCSLLGKGR